MCRSGISLLLTLIIACAVYATPGDGGLGDSTLNRRFIKGMGQNASIGYFRTEGGDLLFSNAYYFDMSVDDQDTVYTRGLLDTLSGTMIMVTREFNNGSFEIGELIVGNASVDTATVVGWQDTTLWVYRPTGAFDIVTPDTVIGLTSGAYAQLISADINFGDKYLNLENFIGLPVAVLLFRPVVHCTIRVTVEQGIFYDSTLFTSGSTELAWNYGYFSTDTLFGGYITGTTTQGVLYDTFNISMPLLRFKFHRNWPDVGAGASTFWVAFYIFRPQTQFAAPGGDPQAVDVRKWRDFFRGIVKY